MKLSWGCATRFIPERIYSRGLTPGMNIDLKIKGPIPLDYNATQRQTDEFFILFYFLKSFFKKFLGFLGAYPNLSPSSFQPVLWIYNVLSCFKMF